MPANDPPSAIGLERSVGVQVVGRRVDDLAGGIKVEMRIVVPDTASAGTLALAERLRGGFGAERVSLNRLEVNVQIESEPDSERSVVRILDAVERWLDRAALASCELWLGGHSYKATRWIPIASMVNGNPQQAIDRAQALGDV